jgi:hypothetical protein
MSEHIAINEEKYKATCKRNAESAKKRWSDKNDARACAGMPTDANACVYRCHAHRVSLAQCRACAVVRFNEMHGYLIAEHSAYSAFDVRKNAHSVLSFIAKDSKIYDIDCNPGLHFSTRAHLYALMRFCVMQ